MLCSVYIENIAVIKKLSFEPERGFCALTGETGAGKSIIIDALSLLCGARSDRDIIRTGEQSATVEGIFMPEDNESFCRLLAELDVDAEEDGSVTVTRKIGIDGRSFAKINGRSVPVSKLKTVMSRLISIHGQQDTYAFADEARQLALIDSFAKNAETLRRYREQYAEYCGIKSELARLSTDEAEREQRIDMLRFRISELTDADIKKGEQDQLIAERKRLSNIEKIISKSSEAYSELYAADGSALERIDAAESALNSLAGYIPDGDELLSRIDSAKTELRDIAECISAYTESDGENAYARLDSIETRLSLISRLTKKYGVPADGLTDLLTSWQDELDGICDSDARIASLTVELKESHEKLMQCAAVLTESRINAGKLLAKRVCEELSEVDMPSVGFEVRVESKDYGESGGDTIGFFITPNKGEEPKPMSKIASGGELSRIMLCLKCVLSDSERIETLIFDEIDTGVSGKTSEKIAIRLKKASDGGNTQIICVTHSALLAARADAHYLISKSVTDDRTETEVRLLDTESRLGELSRILGGMNVTDTVRAAARELLEQN